MLSKLLEFFLHTKLLTTWLLCIRDTLVNRVLEEDQALMAVMELEESLEYQACKDLMRGREDLYVQHILHLFKDLSFGLFIVN